MESTKKHKNRKNINVDSSFTHQQKSSTLLLFFYCYLKKKQHKSLQSGVYFSSTYTIWSLYEQKNNNNNQKKNIERKSCKKTMLYRRRKVIFFLACALLCFLSFEWENHVHKHDMMNYTLNAKSCKLLQWIFIYAVVYYYCCTVDVVGRAIVLTPIIL